MSDLNDRVKFISEIMCDTKLKICKRDALKIALQRKFDDCNEEDSEKVLCECERQRIILCSQDGYAMIYGMYLKLSGDKFDDGLVRSSGPYRIILPMVTPENPGGYLTISDAIKKLKPCERDMVDIAWLLVDMMPESESFLTDVSVPWGAIFVTDYTDDEDSYIYEIVRIHQEEEDSKFELLKIMPKVIGQDSQDHIVRIAIMDNENHMYKLPKVGFKFVCVMDELADSHYRIVPVEDENVWSE